MSRLTFVPQALIDLRVKKGLSQRELAALTGLTQTSISKIESGVTNPRQSTLQLISDALEAPISAFYKPADPQLRKVTVSLSEEEEKALTGFAERIGYSLSDAITQIILESLESEAYKAAFSDSENLQEKSIIDKLNKLQDDLDGIRDKYTNKED